MSPEFSASGSFLLGITRYFQAHILSDNAPFTRFHTTREVTVDG